jgi:hypothetical protein
MGLFGNIGSFFVQLDVKGLDVVQKAFDQVHAGMEKLAKEAKWTGIGMVDVFKGTSTAAAGLNAALAPVTGHLQGMVLAGINVSHFGELLSLRFQELNRQMASVFVPTVDFVIVKLDGLIRWFRSLTGEQQATLRQWGLWIAGIGVAATVLPRVIASVQALGVAVKGVSLVLTGLSVSNPWVLLLTVLAGAGAALAVLGSKTLTLGDAANATVEAGSKLSDALSAAGGAADKLADKTATVVDRIAEAARQAVGLKDVLNESGQAKTGLAAIYGRLRFEIEKRFGLLTQEGLGKYVFGAGNPIVAFLDRLTNATNPVEGGRPRADLMPRLTGFEQAEQTWRRIALTSRNVGITRKEPTEEIAESVKKIEAKVSGGLDINSGKVNIGR